MRKEVKAAKTKSPKTKRPKVVLSSGNVFADLGFKDAEERLLKAKHMIEKKAGTLDLGVN